MHIEVVGYTSNLDDLRNISVNHYLIERVLIHLFVMSLPTLDEDVILEQSSLIFDQKPNLCHWAKLASGRYLKC